MADLDYDEEMNLSELNDEDISFESEGVQHHLTQEFQAIGNRFVELNKKPIVVSMPPMTEIKLAPSDDPFDIANVGGQALIVQMRLYDVLMGIYNHLDTDKAGALVQIHESGKLFLGYPKLSLDEE